MKEKLTKVANFILAKELAIRTMIENPELPLEDLFIEFNSLESESLYAKQLLQKLMNKRSVIREEIVTHDIR
jgi:hypothetical protein